MTVFQSTLLDHTQQISIEFSNFYISLILLQSKKVRVLLYSALSFIKQAITLAKTCEATTEMRECSSPKDWSLLALQNIRTGKSHYLIICRCPDHFKMGKRKQGKHAEKLKIMRN